MRQRSYSLLHLTTLWPRTPAKHVRPPLGRWILTAACAFAGMFPLLVMPRDEEKVKQDKAAALQKKKGE